MNFPPCCSLLLVVFFSVAQAQQKAAGKLQLPKKPTTPSVNCSAAQTSKACSAFKQLLEAHDTDILHAVMSPTSYVCFRPIEVAFLIIHVEPPSAYGWRKDGSNVGQTQEITSSVSLTEYRDGVFYTMKDGRGYWRRFSPDEDPMFHSESTEGMFKGLKISILGAEIFIDYPFENQAGGTTQYSLTLRRSTGRFIETFAGENAPTTTHSGACLIYR